MEQFETRFSQVDVLPMVKHYMDKLGLVNLFAKYVPPKPGSLTDHSESLCILTANIICNNKPLYKVQEWLSQYSDDLGGEQKAASLFNDDRLARALSALFDADRHSLMTEVSGSAIAVHKLLTEEIHNDSTSVTFIGKYDRPDPRAVKLKHGHNKDFRPDCKQIVFGLNITSDGHVPLSYKLFDGNTADDVTHIPNWNALRMLLKKENFVYVADCKLCSQTNLNHMAQNGGFFITIVPKDRKEVKRFAKYLKDNDVEWEQAFKVESSRKKSKINTYQTYEIEKLPILPQGMNTKKPTWNNIRYFFRNVHYAEIIRDGISIQAMVKGVSVLHKHVIELLEVPDAVYKNLHRSWWHFKGT